MTRLRRDILLDTGPLVALLDARDSWHRACVTAWEELAGRCITTEAVVTEATHLVSRGGGPAALVLEFLLAGTVPVLGLEPEGLRSAAALMRRYEDLPMDYADATLVVAGKGLGTREVFTLDRRGFQAYRTSQGKRFSLIPENSTPRR